MTFVPEGTIHPAGWLRGVTGLGMALVLPFILLDILFPNTRRIANKLSVAEGNLAKEGIAGVIAPLLFSVLGRK